VRADRCGHTFEVDVDAEDPSWPQAVEAILRRRGQRWELDLELAHLVDAKRNDQENQAREHDDDRNEDGDDSEHAGHAGRVQADDRGLDQESDRGAEDEGAEEVAEQKEDDDRDDEGRHAEGDLQIPTAPPRIESEWSGRRPAGRGRTLEFSLAGRSRVRGGTHVMQSRAV